MGAVVSEARDSHGRWTTSSADVTQMVPGKLTAEYDKLSKHALEISNAMIDAGRGAEKFSESRAKAAGGDALAGHMMRVHDRQSTVRAEMERRVTYHGSTRRIAGLKQ